uniref:Uncharacterized protein n=1 Tax=Solanum tuberosum TaxID=4113 RepID=M1DF94_SOLTU
MDEAARMKEPPLDTTPVVDPVIWASTATKPSPSLEHANSKEKAKGSSGVLGTMRGDIATMRVEGNDSLVDATLLPRVIPLPVNDAPNDVTPPKIPLVDRKIHD